ncbi:peptidoglycan DD-metalloendopeptidase family protein [Streptosporangium sp. NPDC048047]|uniref:murein hydrolase activator EnvC family protein n=1 Tax=Streptosporangium sp. NPDC048047 TaxID=3155748 RepID=UPI0034354833
MSSFRVFGTHLLLPALLLTSSGAAGPPAPDRGDRTTRLEAVASRPDSRRPSPRLEAASSPRPETPSSPRPGNVEPSPRWGRPLAGRLRVLREFAPPARPWLAGHRGTDLAAPPGTEVRAAGAGTVGYAGPLAGRGVVTVLHDGGLRTTYLPVTPSVRHGQTVERGQVIGTLQDVPGHCPAGCLHWGLLRDWLYLDPLLLLGRGRVRLLPVRPARRDR